MQAAVAGVPMVLSRAPGHLEMLQADTEALFCDIDDPATMAAQLVRLMDDADLAEHLRQAAYRRVAADFSERAVTEKLLQALSQITDFYINNKFLYI